mmetsp:Transcript_9734/g.29581  ORF Transcript_9734/g.29581 Transcript_9734/m.29581 type:complete len:88 (+) Transcript_9734:154-417(+)
MKGSMSRISRTIGTLARNGSAGARGSSLGTTRGLLRNSTFRTKASRELIMGVRSMSVAPALLTARLHHGVRFVDMYGDILGGSDDDV